MKVLQALSVAAAVLIGAGLAPALAADLAPRRAGPAVEVRSVETRTVEVAPVMQIVPYCVETPAWALASPPLLRCAPREYFKPTSTGALNLHKAIQRPPRPYLEIYRE